MEDNIRSGHKEMLFEISNQFSDYIQRLEEIVNNAVSAYNEKFRTTKKNFYILIILSALLIGFLTHFAFDWLYSSCCEEIMKDQLMKWFTIYVVPVVVSLVSYWRFEDMVKAHMEKLKEGIIVSYMRAELAANQSTEKIEHYIKLIEPILKHKEQIRKLTQGRK